mgnify:CR=1 FL=1
MGLDYYLPYLIWWLFIAGLMTLGVWLIGLAIISMVVEREELDK